VLLPKGHERKDTADRLPEENGKTMIVRTTVGLRERRNVRVVSQNWEAPGMLLKRRPRWAFPFQQSTDHLRQHRDATSGTRTHLFRSVYCMSGNGLEN